MAWVCVFVVTEPVEEGVMFEGAPMYNPVCPEVKDNPELVARVTSPVFVPVLAASSTTILSEWSQRLSRWLVSES